jgi:DNA-binding transcriptional ArsR family regulator
VPTEILYFRINNLFPPPMSSLGHPGGKSISQKPECPGETTGIPYFLQVADFSFDFCRQIATIASIVEVLPRRPSDKADGRHGAPMRLAGIDGGFHSGFVLPVSRSSRARVVRRAHRAHRTEGPVLVSLASGIRLRPRAPHRRLEALRMNGRGWDGQMDNIAQLTANTDISRQAVTKHLQVLTDAGVVRDVKLGRERLWQPEPGQIEETKRTLELIGREWEVALAKLKTFAESV